ncbi:DNA mismatch repair protein MSH6 [Vitis vinifera]|uniref:DNA mismatch repair protein MSH6 n=1 Tax=Vitis vinifera TaxID=29760 RepID=A0A438IXK7_VITVI|nr:DNA mismatch repair protein MSH6 [Vitis vinifera]
MAPTRRMSNGRSPLVNQQSQITATLTLNLALALAPALVRRLLHLCKPSFRKPLLVIGPSKTTSPSTPVTGSKSYGEEVVNRRVKVYWPLDKSWYVGCVKSFDELTGEHLVQYDDADEETLDLGKEKIEWVEDKGRSLRRLRRGSVFEKGVVPVGEANVEEESGGDDSSDEDWERVREGRRLKMIRKMLNSRKRRMKKRKLRAPKKGKVRRLIRRSGRRLEKEQWVLPLVEAVWCYVLSENLFFRKASDILDNVLPGDALERFGAREAEKLPFLGGERKDAKRRCPGDANYDPRTLYLPPNFLKNLTGGQRQWWEFKSRHMDKVIFFKMGKFYELFEMDAHIGAKELDLQYMKGGQPHCGFPEKNFSINVEKLARKGYRVLVVEQTETPEQLELRRKEKGSKDKLFDLCGHKGTLTEGEMLSANPDASYLMAVTESYAYDPQWDLFLLLLNSFYTIKKDDSECSTLCCLLSELRPVEIIKPANLLSPETERALMRHTRSPLVNELVPISEFWDSKKTVSEIRSVYRCFNDLSVSGSLNEANLSVKDSFVEEDPLGLPDILSKFAKFELFPYSGVSDIFHKPYMVLDAAALENLEIFENSRKGDSSGTLYAQLNHCVTAFGKRLLKTWLARPLYHLDSIRERQDAVAGLRELIYLLHLNFEKSCLGFQTWSGCLHVSLLAVKLMEGMQTRVVFYEDAAKKQLQELYQLYVDVKVLPDIHSVINHFKEAFDWVEANNFWTDSSGYWTPNIKKFLGELSHAESEKESKLKSILQKVDQSFLTGCIDQLAIANDYYEGPTCRPVISGLSNSNEVPCFTAKSLGHPVLRSDSLGKGTFVPMTLLLVVLIMLLYPSHWSKHGWKINSSSQVCLAVILAQVGADVPAESFELSPVDRIFVRMGAKDNIMAGQSTFLTELSETASMLTSATCNSLVALDELGRGTSTSDGQAIAESVLEHFVHKVSLCHMACQVGKGVGGVEEVTFLYRLRPGACPKSYGVNVARLAGLPNSVLQKAAAKSREIEGIYGRHRKGSDDGCDERLSSQNSEDDMVFFIQSLINGVAKLSYHESFKDIHASSLSDLQQRAKMFLDQN